MGLLKTEKLDNGMIGFECIYGGMEAPFGGIDASKAPRYIDPKCFADASNFLIIDNELCICMLLVDPSLQTPAGVSYPLASSSTSPGVLLGVGRLPCEGVVKSWALYVSPSADSSNYWHYRLILWDNNNIGDSPTTVETYDFPLLGQQITAPAQNAEATVTVSYTFPFSAIQTTAPVPIHSTADGTITPTTYDSKYYEITLWQPSISGLPTTGTPYTNYLFWNDYYQFGNTPASGPVTVPTPASWITFMINQINAVGTNYPFTASAIAGNPNSMLLTAHTPTSGGYGSVDGAAGNSLAITGATVSQEFGYFDPTVGQSIRNVPPGYPPHYDCTLANNPNIFSTPSFQISVTPFTGGTDPGQVIYSNSPIQQLTWETIGDSLFLAGWPAGYMLQFNNSTKQFTYLTQYQGARVLKKIAGHLISVGMINSAQQTETNTHLWLNWSKEGVYSEWRALDSSGLVTGAGGEQLADISDMLTGLVVSNSIAFILRAEGLSYASVLQGASVPFDVNHVALCKDGQGCPSTSLWTQFDQLGFYVGNTNVFILSQGPQAIGDKILETLFPQLIAMADRLGPYTGPIHPPPPFTIAGNPPPMLDKYYNKVNTEPLSFPQNMRVVTQFGLNVGGILFMFDPQDNTWMKIDTGPIFPGETITPDFKWNILKCCSLPRNGQMGYTGSYQNKESYVYGQSITNGNSYAAPLFYRLSPLYENPTQEAHVYFPSEEISFGRDITIDALYVLACGLPNLEIDFTIDGWQGTYVSAAFFGKLIFGPNASPGNYEEYQVFDQTGKAITLKAPQLRYSVPPQNILYLPPVPYPVVTNPCVKIAKIAMFGSFDPSQRPV